MVEEMSIEKQTLVERYEREIKALKDESHNKEQQLITESDAKVADLKQQYSTEAEMERREADEYIKKLKEVRVITEYFFDQFMHKGL